MLQSDHDSKVMAVGGSALKGWRGRMAGAVAKPVARHSRFTEDQVKAFLGLGLLAYAIYRLARPIVDAARA